MRRLALLAVLQTTCALTAAPALRRSRKLALLSTPADDDEAPPEISEDFRDFRARLIARTKGEGLTEAGDEKAEALANLEAARKRKLLREQERAKIARTDSASAPGAAHPEAAAGAGTGCAPYL